MTETLSRAKAGDKWAKEEFFREHYPDLPKVIGRYLKRGMPHEVLVGLAHTAMMTAYKAYNEDVEQPFLAYWRTAMDGRVNNHWRDSNMDKRAVVHHSISLETPTSADGDSTIGDALENITDGDDAYEQADNREIMRELLAELSCTTSNRDMFILRKYYADDVNQRELATELGVSQMTISRILNKGIQELRAIAQERGLTKGGAQMARVSVDTKGMKYLFETKLLYNGEIAEIIGATAVTVGKYRARFNAGKMSGVKPDPAIEVQYSDWFAGLEAHIKRKIMSRREKPKTPEVTAYKLDPVVPQSPVAYEPPAEPTVEQMVAATSEDPLPVKTYEEEPVETYEEEPEADLPVAKAQSISLALDGADSTTIELFLTTLRTQMSPGKLYDFTVHMKEAETA